MNSPGPGISFIIIIIWNFVTPFSLTRSRTQKADSTDVVADHARADLNVKNWSFIAQLDDCAPSKPIQKDAWKLNKSRIEAISTFFKDHDATGKNWQDYMSLFGIFDVKLVQSI